jgi:polar amino acid transport system substrate-binding protein
MLAVLAVFYFLSGSLGFAGEPSVSPIKFLTHSIGEQTYVDQQGQLRGVKHGGRRAFNVELIRDMMLLKGQATKIEIVPFKRGLELVQSSPGYALFNVNRTEERESTVKWVGPIQSSTTHFYENRDAPTGVKSMEDAKHVESICVLRGNTHQRFLEERGFKNIYPANSYANCVDMLALKRVSMTPLSNLSTLIRSDSNSTASLLQKTPVQIMESKGYLAFSKETPDKVINEWQAALDSLVVSGRYDELVDEYLVTDSE